MIKRLLFNIKTGVKKVVVKVFPVLFLTSGGVVLIVMLCLTPEVKRYVPWVSNYITAYRYERMANKLPYSDIQGSRYRAMAEALKNNSQEYTFETGTMPTMK